MGADPEGRYRIRVVALTVQTGGRLMLTQFWKDEAGFVTLEYLFGATILAIGLTVGYVVLKNSINAEMVELGQAVTALNQSYSYSSLTFGTCASTGGSAATDTCGSTTVLTSVTATACTVAQATCP
jgi:Flp pilus assembly pilin Flp